MEKFLPRYFVDVQDGDDIYQDDLGSELKDFEQARQEALASLAQIARDNLMEGAGRECIVTIRNECGTSLYRATLAFYDRELQSCP